jgi:FKBP-type peptidyl-prolyl cis-trans isomerase 2
LGDDSWPDGLQTGVEKMRKGEIAKIRIKKKHGFGRPLRVEKLRFPQGYDEEGSEQRSRLLGETVIYEVELVDF